MANSTRTQLSTDSLSLFPDNNSQLITPADLREWITSGIESFVTQKDKSTFENAFYECQSSPITATSGTTNLALATGNFVHITGSGSISITSFGTLPPGSRFVLCFDIAVTLVYNSTTMILPGAANIVTAPGDSVMIISEGGGNWRLIGYFPSSGLPVGTVTAVTATTPLSSTGGNAPDISISKADATTDGYLDSGDFATFSGKQDALTLTTSGSSGPATLTGATLNIPQYTGGTGTVTSVGTSSPLTGGPITGSGTIGIQDAAADGTTKGAATFASSDFNASSGVISIDYANGQEANASQDGFLSKGDWATFNNKQAALTLTTTGSSGPATLTGATLNIPQYSGSTGGNPGGAIGEIQYNVDNTNFGGVPDLTYEGTPTPFVVIKNPKIGSSNGNGHLHIHSANSAPTGITDYLTMFWQKATRVLGFRSETDTNETYIQITAPTADRTLTLPDASGNVVIDTTVPSFSNGASAGEIRLLEPTSAGSNYVALKAPAAIGPSNVTFTLPDNAGVAGYLLRTDGSGNLSWYAGGGFLTKFLKNYTQTTITNPVANTILEYLLIPANTISSDDCLGAMFRVLSTTTASAINVNWSINTSISTGGGVLISGPHLLNIGITGFIAATQIYVNANTVGNPTTRLLNGSVDVVANSTTIANITTIAIDWTVNQYIIVYTGASANRNLINLGIQLTPQ